jgi:Thrombospondin type 3 repeat
MIKNNNNTPYVRKKISSTLLPPLSAIALLLLAASPQPFFNILLLQPVQAETTPMTFKTPSPVFNPEHDTTLTFEGRGTNSSGSQPMTGSYEVKNYQDGTTLYSGNIETGGFTNSSSGEYISLGNPVDNSGPLTISTSCSTSDDNLIDFLLGGIVLQFNGAVECSPSSQGGGNTASSSTTGTTTRDGDSSSGSSSSTDSSSGSNSNGKDSDGDGDGIPDSNDNCPNHSHHRCFKEGDTSDTTQQPSSSSSSSNGTGNQTRQ